MPYRFVAHTSEVELELESATLEALYADAAAALAELIADGGGEPVSCEVRVEAADRAALLAEWLAELAFLAETRGLVPGDLAELELGERSLRAVVRGRTGEPRQLVKAVTYHGLVLEERRDGWLARVVLDV